MAITSALIDVLARIFGFGAGIAAAAAAMWKFLTWWRDRGEQARLDSATFFLKSDAEPWHKAFGEQELTRIHFKRLTGVDRRNGHQAVLLLHERLGQSDDDWQDLRKAGRYVRTRGSIATVRKLHPRDFVRTTAIAASGLVSFGLGVLLFVFTVNFGLALIGRDVRLFDVMVLLIAMTYAGLGFLWAWNVFLYVQQAFAATTLRKRLTTLKTTRKSTAAKSS